MIDGIQFTGFQCTTESILIFSAHFYTVIHKLLPIFSGIELQTDNRIEINKVFFIKLFIRLLVRLHATSGGRKQEQTGKKNRFCFFHKV